MRRLGVVSIVGVVYTIYEHQDYQEINEMNRKLDEAFDPNFDPLKKVGVSGYCAVTSKEIHIFVGHGPEYVRETLIHEVMHAFLYEIGNSHWNDEEFVDKLAAWYPKVECIVGEYDSMRKRGALKGEMGECLSTLQVENADSLSVIHSPKLQIS